MNFNIGDPDGRRIAQRRALLLGEAGDVVQALLTLLRRAEFDDHELPAMLARMKDAENAQLVKAHGRLTARTRYKGMSSHPLLEKRVRSNLFIDECGKSFPEPHLNPSFFSLGAVALSDSMVTTYCAAANEIKKEFFGTTNLTFHEPDMRQRSGVYYFSGDVQKQEEFDQAMDGLVDATDFVAFGVGVRKNAFEKEFVEAGSDPYLPTDAYELAIILLMERYVDYLANCPDKMTGKVTFESQGTREDAEHPWGFAKVLLYGTQWLPDSVFRNWIAPGVEFNPKRGSDPTELSDMFSRNLYEWIRDDCQSSVRPKRWDVFNRKIYCRADGLRGKFGVKVFPDSDIRDRVEAHRADCGATLK
ncbi:MAG: hypothetical protein WD208_00245 [Dehalococcoidia bacterium]